MKVEFHSDMGAVTAACGGVLVAGAPDRAVGSITTDSRNLGSDSLFVPLIGDKFDGHAYIEGLAGSGSIAGFLTMRDGFEDVARRNGVSAVRCDNTLRAYGRIASAHRRRIDPEVIGITGTNGKTTVKELLWAVLSAWKPCLKNEKNYNNEVGVPYTLLHLRREHRLAVIEMGMNHAGEVSRLSSIAAPDTAVITCVGAGHLEFLGSVENVARAKAEIMDGMERGGRVYLNRDTEYFDLLDDRARERGLDVVTFGLGKNAMYFPEDYRLGKDSLSVTLKGARYDVPLYGVHNVYNLLAALTVSLELGIGTETISRALASFKNVDMRSQIIDKGFIVINDTYNSNPLSSRYAFMSAAAVFTDNRKIAVLGDMKELGGESARYHRETGRAAAECGFDMLFAVGGMAGEYAAGAVDGGMRPENTGIFGGRGECAARLARLVGKGDVVLVKGSRSMKMEEVVDLLVR